MLVYMLAIAAAYLLGSIPFGLLVSQALGQQDPRTAGSKNIGFTNVLRVSGKKAGLLTLVGDIGKGVLVTGLGQSLGVPVFWVLVMGFAVVVGHIFSIFLKFKGGKGVATALGAVVGIQAMLGLCLFGVWVGTVLIFRYSSGGALGAFVSFPVFAYFLAEDVQLIVFAFCILGLIVYGHTENISRLLKGTEAKMRLFSI